MMDPEGESFEAWAPSGSAPPRAPSAVRRLRLNWFGAQGEMRRHRLPTLPWTPNKVVAFVLVALAVGLFLVTVAASAVAWLEGASPPVGATAAQDLVEASLLTLVLLVLPPLVWVAAFYRGGMRATRWRLLLRSDRPARDVLLGVVGAIGFVVMGIALVALLDLAGAPTENPVVEALGAELTWTAVIVVAASAGIAEEVFFRGFLQGRLGIVPANVLFGLAHLDYGTPLQVALPMGLGFVFSWLTLRTRSLYPAIIAHAGFDFVMLTLTKLSADLGWTALAA